MNRVCELCGLFLLASTALAQVQLQFFVAPGWPAPGVPGATFQAATIPIIAADGRFAVRARLTTGPGGVHAGNDLGLWLFDQQGNGQLVLREGDIAPGTGGETFGEPTISHTWIGDRLILTEALYEVTPSSPPPYGYWYWSPSDGLERALLVGVPFADGTRPYSIAPPKELQDGSFFFRMRQWDPDNSAGHGLWRALPDGDFVSVVRTNDAAPGTAGAVFEGFFDFNPLRPDGHTVFLANLINGVGDTTDFNRFGLWERHADGQIELLHRERDVVPGAANRYFRSFNPSMSSFGTAFTAGLSSSPDSGSSGETAIFVRQQGSDTQLRYRRGDATPGLPGFTFASFEQPRLNANGDLSFKARLNPGDIGSFWRQRPGQAAELLARNGAPAPGTNARFRLSLNFNYLTMNNYGWVAFMQNLIEEPGGATSADNRGLWLVRDDEVHLLVRKGQTLNVAKQGVDNRIVADILFAELSAGDELHLRGMTDRGDVACVVYFTDGTGAALVASIPRCAADCNGDDVADLDDLLLVLGHFGEGNATLSEGDLDGNGVVNLDDLLTMLGAFGTC